MTRINKLLVRDLCDCYSCLTHNVWFSTEKWQSRRITAWHPHDSSQPVSIIKSVVNVYVFDVNKVKVAKYTKQNKNWAKNENVSKYSWNDFCNQLHSIQHVDSPQCGQTTSKYTHRSNFRAPTIEGCAHAARRRIGGNRSSQKSMKSAPEIKPVVSNPHQRILAAKQ